MIRSKRVQFISAKTIAAFDAYSKKEWKVMKPIRFDLYRKSRAIWTLYTKGQPLCVIGLLENTLIGSGVEVYFLICEAAVKCRIELIKFLKRAFRRVVKLYGMITVSIETTFKEGENFVRLFGFREVDHIFEREGIKFKHFELRASWLR